MSNDEGHFSDSFRFSREERKEIVKEALKDGLHVSDSFRFSREERKEIVKEALKEWLNEVFERAQVSIGKYLMKAALAAIVAAVAYFILWMHSWKQ